MIYYFFSLTMIKTYRVGISFPSDSACPACIFSPPRVPPRSCCSHRPHHLRQPHHHRVCTACSSHTDASAHQGHTHAFRGDIACPVGSVYQVYISSRSHQLQHRHHRYCYSVHWSASLILPPILIISICIYIYIYISLKSF